MRQFPSIFNDVMGPVMIGPSSSHTAAAVRIGRILRALCGTDVKRAEFFFDRNGSLAGTYHSQGSDIGLAGGFLGYETSDPRIAESLFESEKRGIGLSFTIGDYGFTHPNTYSATVASDRIYTIKALSTGGGMIEITRLDGFEVSLTGGFYETLIFCAPDSARDIAANSEGKGRIAELCVLNGRALLIVKSEKDDFHVSSLIPGVVEIKRIPPVLPVISQAVPYVPFITADAAVKYSRENNLTLYGLALEYESFRGGFEKQAVLERMKDTVRILRESLSDIKIDYPGRILQKQHHLPESRSFVGGEISKKIVTYVTKFMEIKSSMGVFAAAPTAGSCGCVAGTIFALADELSLSDEETAKAFLAAGMLGVFIAWGSTFAAELCGCQAECGSASGMAAAACAYVLGGGVEQSFSAASMALQNVIGMVCDPVANRVEVPCLGKNIMAAVNALTCADMALCGFEQVIPLDETIGAMYEAGRSLPMELRCTGLGGLSVAKTSLEIRKKLEEA